MLTSDTVRQPTQNRTSSTRILLVEADNISNLLLSDYFDYLGYNVFSLSSGRHFFSSLGQFQPHLILLDLNLKDVNSYDLLKQLYQSRRHQHIKTIVTAQSAQLTKSMQWRALASGACACLMKPLNLSELDRTLSEQLALPSVWNS
jgi:two-component system, cell cycle response regulator DivK